MSKFKYKFEGIQKVKMAFKKKAQKELSLIDIEISKRKDEIRLSIDDKKKQKTEVLNKKNLKASELIFADRYEKVIDNRIEKLKDEITYLNKKRNQKLIELTQKSKESRIFEKLKEKHKVDFRKEEKKKELKEIDDVAAKKFMTKS